MYIHPMADAIVIAPRIRGCCCYGNASILCGLVPVFEIFFSNCQVNFQTSVDFSGMFNMCIAS